jgi:putative ABC transport system substrate-binding protein
VEPISLETATQAPDVDAAFSQARGRGVEALVVYQAAVLNPHRARITELAAQARLPAVYPTRSYVADGGLMSYGPDFTDLYRRTARYVDEILRGAGAADLPIEQPRSFEFAINSRVARSLGLTIPQSVSMQATEVIQ